MIIFYFVLYSLLVSLLFFWVEGKIVYKAVTITLLFYIAGAVWFSTDSFKGWPTRADLGEGIVLAVAMAEPTNDDEGGIFIWMVTGQDKNEMTLLDRIDPRTMFAYEGERAPRAFRIEYNENNAQMAAKIKKALADGMIVVMGEDGKPAPEGSGEGEGQGAEFGALYQDGSPKGQFQIINPVEQMQK